MTLPVDVDDVTPEWLSQVLGLDIVATEVLDRHSGTTGRARLALTYGGGDDGGDQNKERPPGFFDWGMVMSKAGMWDVAYVICNSVPTEIRRANERAWIARYREHLAAEGVELGADDAWEQYRLYAVYSWNSAVSTAAMRSRWQPEAGAHAAMLRTTTAIEDLDSVSLLERMLRA
jgi:hypothetical protein